jgi:putative methionine-R-sulfoxide reductase with GAF domain
MLEPLALHASPADKRQQYQDVFASIQALLEAETDWVSAMATIVCELHHAFDLTSDLSRRKFSNFSHIDSSLATT